MRFIQTKKLTTSVISAALVLLLMSCAFGKDDNLGGACAAESEDITAQRQTSFSGTVMPLFSTYNCKNCHGSGSSTAPYAFAASDAGTAYPFARKFSNFTSPGASGFVTKLGSGHNCQSNCAAWAQEMEAQITAWAAGEAGLPPLECDLDANTVTVRTKPATISIADLSLAVPKSYRFDLSQATPPVANAGFEVRAKMYTAPNLAANPPILGAYLLQDPKFGFSGSSNYLISNIQMYVNGHLSDTAVNLAGIDFVVAPGSYSFGAQQWSFPILTADIQLLLVEQSAGDSIEFQIDIAPTDEPADVAPVLQGCKDENLFITNVENPIIVAKNCKSCHANPANSGYARFPMTGDLCATVLQKVSFAVPADSIFINQPQNKNGFTGHDPVFTFSGGEETAIRAWITREAQLAAQ